MTSFTFAVFDMDEVLYDYEHPVRLQLLEDLTGRTQAEIHEAVWGGPHENLAEMGQPDSAEGCLAQFADLLGYPIDFDTWADIRRQMMRPRLDVLDMVRRLAEQTDVALLTNNGMLLKEALPVCAPEVLEIFGGKSHVSAEFQARKPDPGVFLRICARYGHDPMRTLFVDDREENIEGAQTAGLTAHLYRSPTGLETFLRECGFSPK
ncbi:HAD-IA family hydrolase [Roseibium litorale]|uniref:HAD-IA family hydrolase n=1 Tax=Roseibium litorale TaxID=2803841 RepID=A0ABR9CQP0_9HYPH|nr:HAD-IA family hydrolase [Roseibium litorale]MBD8892993.1 HAD-IA family hydrolase [Roseibium litorale]